MMRGHFTTRYRASLFFSFAFAAVFAQSAGVELVLEKPQGDQNSAIHAVSFTDQSTLRVVLTHGRDTEIVGIGGQDNAVRFTASMLSHNAVALAGDMLVGLAPLQAEIFDLKRQKQVGALKVDGIDAWPLSCESAICAWQSGGNIHVEPILGRGQKYEWAVGEAAVLSLHISPDARIVAAGLNEPRVRLWSLRDGSEFPSLPLEATPDSSILGAPVSVQDIVPRSFVFPRPGMATVVRFSPDGTLLAAANETAIHVWNARTGERIGFLRGYKGRVAAMAFGADSRTLVVASEDRTVRLFRLGQQTPLEICTVSSLPHFVALRPDGRFAAVGLADGSIELWSVTKRFLGARIQFVEDGWVATTPSGLFDTSESAWRHAAWRFGGPSGTTVPIEAFYRDFYRPGLIADVLSEKAPENVVAIGPGRPQLPIVNLIPLETNPARMVLVPGQGIRTVPERARFRVEARPAIATDGVFDMEVAVNGIVVKKWLGKQAISSTGAVVHEVDLEMPPGNGQVSAFAFNANGVRSTEFVWSRPMQGFGYVIPQRTLYFLGIGISTYRNSAFNLDFAESDVKLLAKALGTDDGELQKVSQRVMDWSNRRTLETLQSTRLYEVPAHVEIKMLLNEQASRSAVLAALGELAKTAQPKDAVIIYYAGHGISDQSTYYLLPWDMGIQGAPRRLSRAVLNGVRNTLITDDDIVNTLQSLNVKYGALIFDSCYSGQALEGSELLGPIRAQGLTGWAYEKGINLLAASEEATPSFEIKKLGSSVLATALVREGLIEKRADSRPLDGAIEIEEWLRYGAARVPGLALEAAQGKQASPSEPFQKARLAPSRVQRKEALVVAAADREP
jgi:WD40 repeat protein